MTMLRLRDRLQIALGAGMGCQLDSGDVETVARFLVVLDKLKTVDMAPRFQAMVREALKPVE